MGAGGCCGCWWMLWVLVDVVGAGLLNNFQPRDLFKINDDDESLALSP